MRTLGLALAASALLLAAPAQAAARKDWDRASTAGEAGLVALALGLPAAKGDGKGAVQAGASMAAALGVTTGLKHGFPELRPDESDRLSFPSGHTSVSFAAAATIQQRYGWKIGLPATVAAGFVGLARVEARKHHWYDVAVGAGIGELSGILITSRRGQRVEVLPFADTKGGGFVAGMRF
jgi:membrane-associated phospholipid phosphatase